MIGLRLFGEEGVFRAESDGAGGAGRWSYRAGEEGGGRGEVTSGPAGYFLSVRSSHVFFETPSYLPAKRRRTNSPQM